MVLVILDCSRLTRWLTPDFTQGLSLSPTFPTVQKEREVTCPPQLFKTADTEQSGKGPWRKIRNRNNNSRKTQRRFISQQHILQNPGYSFSTRRLSHFNMWFRQEIVTHLLHAPLLDLIDTVDHKWRNHGWRVRDVVCKYTLETHGKADVCACMSEKKAVTE